MSAYVFGTVCQIFMENGYKLGCAQATHKNLSLLAGPARTRRQSSSNQPTNQPTTPPTHQPINQRCPLKPRSIQPVTFTFTFASFPFSSLLLGLHSGSGRLGLRGGGGGGGGDIHRVRREHVPGPPEGRPEALVRPRRGSSRPVPCRTIQSRAVPSGAPSSTEPAAAHAHCKRAPKTTKKT